MNGRQPTGRGSGTLRSGSQLRIFFVEEGHLPDNLLIHKDFLRTLPEALTSELKARRFAGVVRLQTDATMPKKFRKWLAKQLEIDAGDVYVNESYLGLTDLARLEVPGRDDLRYPAHEPVQHPRLRGFKRHNDFFDEIKRGDILVHHPYHSFDKSVLRLIESAAVDPSVLARLGEATDGRAPAGP